MTRTIGEAVAWLGVTQVMMEFGAPRHSIWVSLLFLAVFLGVALRGIQLLIRAIAIMSPNPKRKPPVSEGPK